MLYLTSFLFGTCSLHAMYLGKYVMGALYMMQHGLSTIYHSHYTRRETFWMGEAVCSMDKLMARVIWASILYQNNRLPPSILKWVVYVCIVYVPAVYYSICKHYPYYKPFEISYRTWMHGSMHIMGALGSHICMYLQSIQ